MGVTLRGDLDIETVVAQGCRPIGSPLFVTSSEGGVLSTLDGRPPMTILQELFEAGDPRERALLQSSLFLGIQMEPGRDAYGQGDFLVRNLVGVDEERGAIAVAGEVSPNDVVQFRLVRTEADMDAAEVFEPEFTHQVFRDDETVFVHGGGEIGANPVRLMLESFSRTGGTLNFIFDFLILMSSHTWILCSL